MEGSPPLAEGVMPGQEDMLQEKVRPTRLLIILPDDGS